MNVLKGLAKIIKKSSELTNELARTGSSFNVGYPICRITHKCPFVHEFDRSRRCHELHEDCPLISLKILAQ